MKICAIICEYNPFHNGHLYQIQQAKRLSKADAVLCIMSGNFVQRGEAAIIHKFQRAKHALLGGADVVIELPTIFATSNAELFAKGAISILSSIPSVTHLCFGVENADKESLHHAAKLLNNEPTEISKRIKEWTAQGQSYVKAKCNAWKEYLPDSLLSSPNNILGIEYTRAILAKNAKIDILPIKRIGAGYSEETMQENYSSASAIRKAVREHTEIANNLPDFVKVDLPSNLDERLETLEKFALIEKSSNEISRVLDCTEGLENALKKAAENHLSLVETLTNARYTSSRIRRIALQNLLNIEESLIRSALNEGLYLRILAAKKENKDLLSALSESNLPLIVRASDGEQLPNVAKEVYDIDVRADKLYGLLYPIPADKIIFK